MTKSLEYIVCLRRKGNPRVPVEICFDCRWKKKCAGFQEFQAWFDAELSAGGGVKDEIKKNKKNKAAASKSA